MLVGLLGLLVKIKDKNLRGFSSSQFQRRLASHGHGISTGQGLAVQGHFTFRHMHPGVATGGE